ncbi:hypothetical protein GW17_00001985 [Ensete ventricosum]|nr:hypothetical protein GW17_00001985 [Ensete ventricosum]
MSVGATASGCCSVIEGCPWRRRRVVGKTDEVIGANVAVFDCSTENPNRYVIFLVDVNNAAKLLPQVHKPARLGDAPLLVGRGALSLVVFIGL